MPSPGGPVLREPVPNRAELTRELGDLEARLQVLEGQFRSLTPAARANAELERSRLKLRIEELRQRLGR